MSEQNIINKYINELANANHAKFVQQDQIETLTTQIAEKDSLIGTLSQQLTEKDNLINTLKQDIADKNDVIEGKVVN